MFNYSSNGDYGNSTERTPEEDLVAEEIWRALACVTSVRL